jgi:hypothetical protein
MLVSAWGLHSRQLGRYAAIRPHLPILVTTRLVGSIYGILSRRFKEDAMEMIIKVETIEQGWAEGFFRLFINGDIVPGKAFRTMESVQQYVDNFVRNNRHLNIRSVKWS